MPKMFVTTAIAMALAAAVPAANAQTAANRDARAVQANETLPHSVQADEIRVSKMIGSTVYDVQNRKIGSVADIILNKDGKADAVVVDVGSFLGMGGKNVAVKPSELKTDNNRLTLDRSKEQLQEMANYELANRDTGAGTTTSPAEGGRLGTGSPTGR